MDPSQPEKLKTLLNSTTGAWIGLAIALVVLAIGFHYLRSWYRGSDDPADTSEEILKQMGELHRQGDLSEEEFRSIKSQFSSDENQTVVGSSQNPKNTSE